MMAMRIIICFLFMFILLLIRDCCSANSHLDMKKNLAAEEAIVVGLEVASAAEVENTKLEGRKMMSRESLEKEIMKEEVLNQKEAAISGAAHSILNRKRKRKGSILKAKCKLRSRSHSPDDHYENVKMAG